MWEINARMYFVTQFHMEPEHSTFIGAFPEDSDPTHVVYQMAISPIEDMGQEGIKKFVISETTSAGLLTRFADEQEEKDLELLGTLNLNPQEQEDPD